MNGQEIISKALAISADEKKALEDLLRKAGFENVKLIGDTVEEVNKQVEAVLQENYFELAPLVEELAQDKKRPSDKKILKAVASVAFVDKFRKKISPKLNDSYLNFYDYFGSQYKSEPSHYESKFTKEMREWVDNLPNLMHATTGREIIKLIDRTYSDGMGIEWLRTRLSELEDFSHARARTTAITETLRMYSASQYEAMDNSDWVVGQEWTHLNGVGEPRLSHSLASGQQVKTGGVFTIDGEKARFPRDPNLSMWNSINCHCFIKPIVKNSK